MITIDDNWLPENEHATKFCEDNESRLRNKAAVKKDVTDKDFQKTATLKDCLFDFGAKYKDGTHQDPDEYFKTLDDA